MPSSNAKPYRIQPITVADSLDLSQTGPGGMLGLNNLIPDPTTKNVWIPRPAVTLLANPALFNAAGYSTTGFVSALIITGNLACGLISKGLSGVANANDVPFVFNLLTNTFVAVTGVTAGNTPLSPATTGEWVPPIADFIASKIIFCHPGYPNGANFFGVLDLSVPATPTWSGANTAVNALPSAPVAVKNFNGRAYYACNPAGAQPGLFFSDSNVALTRTNASQILTLNDFNPITALGTLQYINQLGGIVQALIAFKGIGTMYQVQGDAALSNLTLNAMNLATGTLAPLSITNTPKGLVFLSPDGFRLIDQNGVISDPLGVDGGGVCVPFIYSLPISRIQASSNAKVVRCTASPVNIPTSGVPNSFTGEYWFDVSRDNWSGPHTLQWDQIDQWNATFIGTRRNTAGPVLSSLYRSDIYPSSSSSYVEDGSTIICFWSCNFLPEQGDMNNYYVEEAYLMVGYNATGDNITVLSSDENNAVLTNTLLINPNTGVTTTWDTGTFDSSVWDGAANTVFSAKQIPFDRGLTFQRLILEINSKAGYGLRFGDVWVKLGTTGFIKGSPLG